MLSISAACRPHFVDHANYTPKELGVDRVLASVHCAQGFMDYTDDSCMQEARDKTVSWPPQGILYNGHAGLGANAVDRSSKNEIAIETLEVQLEGACSPASFRQGNEIVTDNKDPDVAARAKEAVSNCLPEVDDEVLVAFEQGDPRRPYLIASLWNSEDKPPQTATLESRSSCGL